MKIGEFVRTSFRKLNRENKLTVHLVERLQDKKYSKVTFDMNFPVLRKLKSGIPIIDQCQERGYPRYWKDVLTINGEKYILCNDWYDRNRGKFQRWLQNVNT